jgi:hypothetical protein
MTHLYAADPALSGCWFQVLWMEHGGFHGLGDGALEARGRLSR